ncbi:carboxypeptidase A [Plectosphaerella plurivora]|uniref:Carboxypeptidase A n=1 Tax=Plectosphaerella plurivora TaxID=936078 RepID=A0A9P8VM70_9PEZI|nr:carboxypeptidase A [Plectosphaerella plurivora]
MKASMILTLLGASSTALACLTELERRAMTPGLQARQLETGDPGDQNEGKIPIGQGDRFNNGNIAPRGVGSQSNAYYETFLSYAEVESAMRALAKEFKNVEVFDSPYKTYENRTIRGLKIAGKKSNPKKNKGYEVLLQGGVHPRERGTTDHLIYFIADLLWASREKKGLVYGGIKFTAKEVQAAIDLGLVVLPALNPDGAVFDQQTNTCWRKNRNPADADPAVFTSVGVDPNRNFESAWNTTKYIAEQAIYPGSIDPSWPTWYGSGPASEPETKSVGWTLDNFPDVGWYSDTHTNGRVVGFGRCTDSVQTTDKSMNWRNPAYDNVRGIVPDLISEDKYYKEYMDSADLKVVSYAATRMAAAMGESNEDDDTTYIGVELPIISFQQSTGCSIDSVYDRHILDKKKKKVHGIGLEFGVYRVTSTPCPFYPFVEEYNKDMRTVGAAYGVFLLVAAGVY